MFFQGYSLHELPSHTIYMQVQVTYLQVLYDKWLFAGHLPV